MFENYWKVTVRNLLKRKSYTLINILGLGIGLAVCLLIVLFIQIELGFDNFHKNKDNIYRVVLERLYPGRSTSYAIIPQTIGEAVKREYPEVLESTRLINPIGNGNFFVKVGDKLFEEKHVLFADSNFFRVFSTDLVEGDAATALKKPATAVLTETTAKRYFGSATNAIGKSFESDGDSAHLMVSAVCKDWPANSHIAFDILISTSTYPDFRQPNYINFSAYTYLLLNKNASPAGLQAKFPAIIEKYVAGDIEKNMGQNFKQFVAAGNGYNYQLQPIQKIHLNSDLEAELTPNGSMKAVYIFSLVAIFILFIASINFINLSTARSTERAREVGIRKTFGSKRKSLVIQFLLESVVLSVISLVVAIILMFLLLPVFNQVSGKNLSITYFLHPLRLVLLITFSVVVGVIAGLYPAFVLSSFKPIVVLKGRFKSNAYGLLLRNGLVVFQFAISVILIICTIVVNRQMSYMLGDRLGFKKDHIIEIERTDLLEQQTQAFKEELAKIPGVETMASTSALPGSSNFFGVSFQEVGSKEQLTARGIIADEQYATVLGMEMKEGRFLSRDFITDSLAIVLNEKAVAEMHLKRPVGTRLTSPDPNLSSPEGVPYTVVGVIKDFHFQSLHQKITPLVIVNAKKFGDIMPEIAVRIKADQFKTTVESLEKLWRSFVPQRPFHYAFLDKNLAVQYHAEQTIQKLFTVFSVLAIFIACIGLLGLAAYSTQQRLREISIRKILGANIATIITMLSKDFLKLVIIAAIIAFPVAWWAMHAWLQDFAYRTGIPWWTFVIAGFLATVIALATISYQAIKAALASPVESLRSE